MRQVNYTFDNQANHKSLSGSLLVLSFNLILPRYEDEPSAPGVQAHNENGYPQYYQSDECHQISIGVI